MTFKDEQDVKNFKTSKKLVIFQGCVYDVSEYMDYHPGGSDRIERYLGKNIDSVFEQVGHTVAALKIIAQLPKVGEIKGVSTKQDAYSPKLKEKFSFDLNKGLWWQMMNTKWNLEEYNDYIDQPKHLFNPLRSVRLFDNTFLETVTMGPWQLTPMAVIPIAYYFMSQAQTNLTETIVVFGVGMIMFSFFEYCLHRFLFHAEKDWLPDHPYVIACHFVMNGVHHAFP